ncbi:hypothetical protein [Nonomuraea helvata]|uniref:Uncharacterized protein n=1 Tax=Nonomuraea helvata TaxID=37484 RepID=A0ABV5SDL6_9ACTN
MTARERVCDHGEEVELGESETEIRGAAVIRISVRCCVLNMPTCGFLESPAHLRFVCPDDPGEEVSGGV